MIASFARVRSWRDYKNARRNAVVPEPFIEGHLCDPEHEVFGRHAELQFWHLSACLGQFWGFQESSRMAEGAAPKGGAHVENDN
jgi:hypothetical protein